LSQVLEKNGKLDQQISKLDRQLNETKHSLIQTEKIINELTHFKSETLAKSEEIIKIKHDFENEKIRREKAEQKIDELREECKKLKQRAAKLQDENEEIKKENVENTNQLQGVKSKLDFISDIGHTELEKNTALQDQLSETKKKLELTEMKCTSYSQKFDILLKRYETRKVKQKNKIERLWLV
jgi:chromosome segregation ATPase